MKSLIDSYMCSFSNLVTFSSCIHSSMGWLGDSTTVRVVWGCCGDFGFLVVALFAGAFWWLRYGGRVLAEAFVLHGSGVEGVGRLAICTSWMVMECTNACLGFCAVLVSFGGKLRFGVVLQFGAFLSV